MDSENIKRMSFLMAFLFLKMNLLNYDLSPCSLAEGRDKTCINKFPSMLKARGLCAERTAEGTSLLIGFHKQSFLNNKTTALSELKRDE